MTETEKEKTQEANQALADALRVSFRLLRLIMAGLLAAYLLSGIFIVRQHEKAFVLLLGKMRGSGQGQLLGPGIHWTLPRPFSEIIRVPTERVQTLETVTFWPAESALADPQRVPVAPTLKPGRDGYLLTGDANLIHARWAVRYTLLDPKAYLFGYADAEKYVRNELDHAVIRAVAQTPVDEALRTGIEDLRAAVERELVERVEKTGLGLQVQGVDIVALVPPRQVLDAFNAVIEAEQERSRAVSAARAYASRTMNESEGNRARILSEAESATQRLLNEVSSDADYFTKVRGEYARNPGVISRVLLQDTVRRALAGVEQKYVVHPTAGGNQELRLQLSPEAAVPEKK